MTKRIAMTAAVTAVCCLAVRAGENGEKRDLVIRDGDAVATCGDSITFQGGRGYVKYMADYVHMCAGLRKTRFKNLAWFGNHTPYLVQHMDAQILPHKPDVVTIKFGMNSAGKSAALARPNHEKRKAELIAATRNAIDKFKGAGARVVILGSSSPCDTDTMRNRKPTDEDSPRAIASNKSLAVLRDAYRGVAREKEAVWSNVYDDFLAAMAAAKKKYGRNYHVAGRDGVHPGSNGHLSIAYSFLRAMGFDGHIGTITLDMEKGTATATEGHKVTSATKSTVEVESERYPYCFFPDEKGSFETPSAPASLLPCLPFNRDLNRFVLVVKGAKPGKYRVTWGTESATVSSEELAAGINLADAFVKKNPFHDAFREVSGKMAMRFKGFSKLKGSFNAWDKKSPKIADHLAHEKRLENAEKALEASMKPVGHTIRVEPASE
ncbi:MAG: GDSL-type esterase/lipase family protein [Planctomycetota bacterium]|jgi:lysophospholipase L1-like esterase